MFMRYKIMAIALVSCAVNGFAWGWSASPVIIQDLNYDAVAKRIEFHVTGTTYTYVYDCDESGNSYEDGKIFLSILLSAHAQGRRIVFDAENYPTPNTGVWKIRQVKMLD